MTTQIERGAGGEIKNITFPTQDQAQAFLQQAKQAGFNVQFAGGGGGGYTGAGQPQPKVEAPVAPPKPPEPRPTTATPESLTQAQTVMGTLISQNKSVPTYSRYGSEEWAQKMIEYGKTKGISQPQPQGTTIVFGTMGEAQAYLKGMEAKGYPVKYEGGQPSPTGQGLISAKQVSQNIEAGNVASLSVLPPATAEQLRAGLERDLPGTLPGSHYIVKAGAITSEFFSPTGWSMLFALPNLKNVEKIATESFIGKTIQRSSTIGTPQAIPLIETEAVGVAESPVISTGLAYMTGGLYKGVAPLLSYPAKLLLGGTSLGLMGTQYVGLARGGATPSEYGVQIAKDIIGIGAFSAGAGGFKELFKAPKMEADTRVFTRIDQPTRTGETYIATKIGEKTIISKAEYIFRTAEAKQPIQIDEGFWKGQWKSGAIERGKIMTILRPTIVGKGLKVAETEFGAKSLTTPALMERDGMKLFATKEAGVVAKIGGGLEPSIAKALSLGMPISEEMRLEGISGVYRQAGVFAGRDIEGKFKGYAVSYGEPIYEKTPAGTLAAGIAQNVAESIVQTQTGVLPLIFGPKFLIEGSLDVGIGILPSLRFKEKQLTKERTVKDLEFKPAELGAKEIIDYKEGYKTITGIGILQREGVSQKEAVKQKEAVRQQEAVRQAERTFTQTRTTEQFKQKPIRIPSEEQLTRFKPKQQLLRIRPTISRGRGVKIGGRIIPLSDWLSITETEKGQLQRGERIKALHPRITRGFTERFARTAFTGMRFPTAQQKRSKKIRWY